MVKNSVLDKQCKDLEVWLRERRYSEELVRKQILKARKFSRTELLNKQRKKENEKKLVLNITCHPSVAMLKILKTRIHLLLTPDNEHIKVFRNVAIIEFRRAKSLKNILVRAKNLKLKTKVCVALVKDLRKFGNTLYQLGILHHSLQKVRMRLG